MENEDNVQNNELSDNVKPLSRNGETLAILLLFCIVSMIPSMNVVEAGGLYAHFFWLFVILPRIVISAIIYVPMRWMVRLCLDGKKKTAPRIAMLLLFTALITYAVIDFEPGYIKNMKNAGNNYYFEYSQEFEDPSEGKTIQINVLSGPYWTYFVYSNTNPPKQERGGIVVDYENGWYFVGQFIPG